METRADQASLTGNILQWPQPGDHALFSRQALLQTMSSWHFQTGLTGGFLLTWQLEMTPKFSDKTVKL